MNTLHIYGQDSWHDASCIVGDIAGLTALRDALNNIIDGTQEASGIAAFCADGEGYTCFVVMDNRMHDLELPYRDSICRKGSSFGEMERKISHILAREDLQKIDESVWDNGENSDAEDSDS